MLFQAEGAEGKMSRREGSACGTAARHFPILRKWLMSLAKIAFGTTPLRLSVPLRPLRETLRAALEEAGPRIRSGATGKLCFDQRSA